MLARAAEQPGERHLHRRRVELGRHLGEGRRLQRREAAEREEGHIGDANLPELVDQRVVVAMDEVVVVLHASHLGDAARLHDLGGGDVAQPELADQPLSLELGQRGERLLDRAFARPVNLAHHAQVDDVERLDAEVAEVVVDGA